MSKIIVEKNVVEYIHSEYKRISRYVDRDNLYLPKKERIIFGKDIQVEQAIHNLISEIEINNPSDQLEIVDLIFNLHSCRHEKVTKESGAHDMHLEVIQNFNIAADVIKDIMDADPDVGQSKDIQSLYKYIRNCVPGAEVVAKHIGYQAKSDYRIMIYQLVDKIRHISGSKTLDEIFGILDVTLADIYVSGLRNSRTASALEKAYRDGKKLHGEGTSR